MKYSEKEIKNGKGMAIVAYILALIPYFAEKKNQYVRFHAVQGMNLLIISVIYGIISGILQSVIKVDAGCGYWGELLGVSCKVTPTWLVVILTIIGLGFTALAIIGIVYACQGKAKELPIVNKFKIIKK